MSYVTQHWTLDPFVIVVVAIVALHELGLRHLSARSRPERSRHRRRRSYAFYGGLALLLVAVASPVDYWADRYFFVHMLEHILIMFFAPILIVVGAPWLPLVHAFSVGVRRKVGRAVLLGGWARPLRAAGRFLGNGVVAVVLFNAVMLLWHTPAAFDLAQRNLVVHVWLMHGSFFVAGVFFWLQIIPSYPIKPKLTSVGQIVAIMGTNVVMFIMAMTLSMFTSSSWYSVYDHIHGVTLSPFADQQIGAAILWVCGDIWGAPALTAVIRRAMTEEGDGSALIERILHPRQTSEIGNASGG